MAGWAIGLSLALLILSDDVSGYLGELRESGIKNRPLKNLVFNRYLLLLLVWHILGVFLLIRDEGLSSL